MKTEQNQQELSFEQLLEMNDFSLEDGQEAESDLDLNLTPGTTEEEEEEEDSNKETSELQLPISKEEEEEEPVISFNPSESLYSELIKEKLESGEWEDLLIEQEDGTEKKLSELDNIDKDTYQTLQKAIKEEKQKEFSEKYVEVGELDEVKKRLISIVKNGDLELAKALFSNPEALQEPFQGYDVDNDSHNEEVLAWYYQNALGHSPSETKALVKAAKEDLTVDVKAQKIVDYQRGQFYADLENREKQILESNKKEQERIKDYRKNLSSSLKEEGLSETLVRKFVDVATKQDKTGSFEIDNIYDEWMSDPAKAKELIYFMLDKDNYLKKVTSEVKKNVQLDNLKKIKIVQDTSKVEKRKEEDKQTSSSPLESLSFD